MKIKGKLNINNIGNETSISNLGVDNVKNIIYGTNNIPIIQYWTAGTGTDAITTIVNKTAGGNAVGNFSIAEGANTLASGFASNSKGYKTVASGDYSHTEGCDTTASGDYSHTEGSGTTASGNYSHTEGFKTISNNVLGHAEGYYTTVNSECSHVEGLATTADGDYSHAEGQNTTTNGNYSHAEGSYTYANGLGSHVGGKGYDSSFPLKASGDYSFNHSQKNSNNTSYGDAAGNNSAILGGVNGNISSSAARSVVLGGSGILGTVADTVYVPYLNIGTLDLFGTVQYNLGIDSNKKVIKVNVGTDKYTDDLTFASNILTLGRTGGLGDLTTNLSSLDNNTNYYLTNVGINTSTDVLTFTVTGAANLTVDLTYLKKWVAGSSGTYSILTEGNKASGGDATGDYSVAEGYNTSAGGSYSHAEGRQTTCGAYSHAEGYLTTAYGTHSHAEGSRTTTLGAATFSHTEGYKTTTVGASSHAEGFYSTTNQGSAHSEGHYVMANGINSHVGGRGYGLSNKITTSEYDAFNHSLLLIGQFSDIKSGQAVILGGVNNNIGTSTQGSVILGGNSNTIGDNRDETVILGGNAISTTASTSSHTFLPSLIINTTPATSTDAEPNFVILPSNITLTKKSVSWVNITFGSSVSNYGSGYDTCQSKLSVDGITFVKGLARATANSITLIGTLTLDHRPSKDKIFTVIQNSAARRITVKTNGEIVMTTNLNTNEWVSIEVNFRKNS